MRTIVGCVLLIGLAWSGARIARGVLETGKDESNRSCVEFASTSGSERESSTTIAGRPADGAQEKRTRVDIGWLDLRGPGSMIEKAVIAFTSESKWFLEHWTADRRFVMLPPGCYDVDVLNVEPRSDRQDTQASILVRPLLLGVEEDPSSVVLELVVATILDLRVRSMEALAVGTEIELELIPHSDFLGREFGPAVTEQRRFVQVGGYEAFDRLHPGEYELRVIAPGTRAVLSTRTLRFSDRSYSMILHLDPPALGAERIVEFRGPDGIVRNQTVVESCELIGVSDHELVRITGKRSDGRGVVFVEADRLHSVLAAHPGARVEILARDPQFGVSQHSIPLATGVVTCTLVPPIAVSVAMPALDSREENWIVALARFDGARWRALTQPRHLEPNADCLLDPVGPGEYTLLVSRDPSLTEIVAIERVRVGADATHVSLTRPECSAVTFEIAGDPIDELVIETDPGGRLVRRLKTTAPIELPAGRFRAVATRGRGVGESVFCVPTSGPVYVVPRPSAIP